MLKAAIATAAVVAAAVALGAVAEPGRAERDEPQARAAAELEEWRALAATISAPWLQRQRSDGSFPDYMAARGASARDLYGDAMLGYGLLKMGVQQGDGRAVSAGLRGLVRAVANPRPFHSIVFEKLALAAGYNLARARLPGHPLLTASRARWESRLRRMKPTWLGRGRSRYFNQHLVDAVLVLELVRTGLRSRLPGAVSRDPRRGRRLAQRLVNSRLPSGLRSHTANAGPAGAATLASDSALAYHALTLGFYGRAVKLLGRRASPRARSLLDRLARASWALTGPDGDVSYFGRSQEQAWTLPLTSYGAEVAAAGTGRAWAARHRATSRRALQRLRALHAGGPNGLYLTPAFRTDPRAAVTAQEGYVSGSAYSGLTLLGLGWAHDRLGLGGRRAGRLAADGRSAVTIDRGQSRFAVVSTGRVWFAVRQRPAAPRELGSGAGVVALKVRDAGGRWRDVLSHGIVGRPSDSAGPLLRLRARGAALPRGRALDFRRGPSVRLLTDLVTPSGSVVRRSAIAFAPTPCGIRIAPGGRAGERWEYSAFLPPRSRPVRLGRRVVAAGEVRIGYGGAGQIVTGGAYLSPSYGSLVRSRMSVRAPAAFTIGLRRACAPR